MIWPEGIYGNYEASGAKRYFGSAVTVNGRDDAAGRVDTVFSSDGQQTGQDAMTRIQEMEQFKQEFWTDVAGISKHHTIQLLAINISDAGWERMKAEPEYREKMLGLIERDTTANYIRPVDMVLTIGATEREYRGDSWSSGADEFWSKADKKRYIEDRRERKKKRKEYYDKLWLRHFYEHRKLIRGEKKAGNPVLMSELCELYQSSIPFV